MIAVGLGMGQFEGDGPVRMPPSQPIGMQESDVDDGAGNVLMFHS